MAKVIIIGGGPAGMMAAVTASSKHEVVLIEKNERLGRKLYITGKGRCNITNAKDIGDFFENIPCNPNFLYSSLYSFTNEDTMNFFKEQGVNLKVERGDRVFPESDKSSDIIKAFDIELKNKKVEVLLNSKVKRIVRDNQKVIGVELASGNNVYGDYIILCTGGLSYPQTGSSGEGLTYAKVLGHNIIKPKASLVPIELEEEWIKDLQGLSLKNVELNITNSKNKSIYKEFGEMIFTHYGISGPIVLSGSCYVKEGEKLKAFINLKPALSEIQLDKRIQSDFLKYANKDFKNSLTDLLPSKLINTIIQLSNIDEDKKVNSVTKEERKILVNLLQNLPLTIKRLRPIDEAIITSGGVDTLQIDASTMKSKLIDNLYFAGEMIDVDAYTGGYNLQIALSTGFLAGNSVGVD
ncbi:BaiN/RdsA family NAD(P)/FAD-dependent oxidoreductase [Clostridium estertheticum]|uniref:FAD-dependent oxidoreductase n=2 Tax=Clostridium estertheticum TaxID=238834 RepID=A0A1J0GHT8_9CLOT|nr:NAD(P)/FAD-dependent oxidoreductase [Clostridium estertheticum]APC40893.1 FAD-dependent oxidoreductase [Clostridium estertheticum subsp. estertheticum]MBU3073948.1 NAD(P)/FAD-dependent oxidoreductase [Clostridium estertheticum]MBU3164042.1 NAD(P)/FAD-dependent oxidoreductase [Clostridium estertheticum]MBU3169979.1 NAD(P)/FAD-dependent oxidoreductase [Clostridium estertheticum]MBZ9617246.1 NAD(P)/FAD-dependent oxidoreductase [Clostridium estertheticum subsp. laramiense]